MKIKKILLCIILMTSWSTCNLQAGFLSWLWPSSSRYSLPSLSLFSWIFTHLKAPIQVPLDTLINEKIDTYEQQQNQLRDAQFSIIDKRHHLPLNQRKNLQASIDFQNNTSKEAYLAALVKTAVTFQNEDGFKDDNQKIVAKAERVANKAHEKAYTTAPIIWEHMQKAKRQEDELVDILTHATLAHIAQQRRQATQVRSNQCKNESCGYTIIPNLQTRAQNNRPPNFVPYSGRAHILGNK